MSSLFVTMSEEQTAEIASDCTTGFVTMLKTTKIMNIISLVFLITCPINVVLGMTNHTCNCDKDAGDCDYYIFVIKCLDPFRVVCFIVSNIFFLYRLNKTDLYR
jgi:hypothetical protein